MNTNTIHNILNFAMALCAVALLPELHTIFPEDIAIKLASGAATLKLIINVIRDGFSGLVKDQPPVK